MSVQSKINTICKGCMMVIYIFILSLLIPVTTNATIDEQPVPTKIESVVSSQSYKDEYIKVSTPEDEKYTVYVSGKVDKDIKRLCIKIKKHEGKVYITTFVKPNNKGEFSIKINTKKGNKEVPEVLDNKGTVTKADESYGTKPGYRAVKKMASGLYHLYITAATTDEDADVSKESNWNDGTLGGAQGRIFKEALFVVNKKDSNNLKLVKYDEVISNNVEIRNAYEDGDEYTDSYEGSYVLYTDPYMKDIRFVFRNPVSNEIEMMDDEQVEYVAKIANKITKGCDSNYEKGLKIYKYVATGVYYDNYAYNQHENQYANPYLNLYKLNNNIESPNSIDGKVATTCQGFASMVVALARAEEIPARMAYGRHIHQPKNVWTDLYDFELKQITHYWPELYIDGEWIVVDARGATRNQWVRESFEDEGRWLEKKFINYSHFDPTDELLSNSYIYQGIYPGSKEGEYINKENEVEQLTTFLEYESEEGVKNGEKLNENYSSTDYSTWGTEEGDDFKTDGYGNVTRIDWDNKDLEGELDLSDFHKLRSLYVYNNDITSIDLSGCTSLKYISATYNELTELDCSSATEIKRIKLKGNKLKLVKFSYDNEVIKINCSKGGAFSITYNESKDNVLTIRARKPDKGYKYLGIYNADTDEVLTKENRYSFTPDSLKYEVRYKRRFVYKIVDKIKALF